MLRPRPPLVAIALAALALAAASSGCAANGSTVASPSTAAPGTEVTTTLTTAAGVPTTVQQASPPSTAPPLTRPEWLGARTLPTDARGFGQVQPTPSELIDRRLPTEDVLAPPPDDRFHAAIAPVPDAVLARSTWRPECPVAVEELRYVTMSFWGFDERPHTGELLVNAEVADDVVRVFRRLHEARFPIEEMRITRADELDLAPTGDGNNTGSFVCRVVRGSSAWSQHAFGLAIDINPFHNPYRRGELVLPELASAYLDRTDVRPGMILAGDVVTAAFADLGWEWGGSWQTLEDHQHFSRDGG